MKCWCWITTFFIWFAIIFTIYNYNPNKENEAYFILLAFAAIIYLITAWCDPAANYLLNFTTCADVHDYMEKLFYTPIKKVMKIQCYHNETVTITEKDSNTGESVTRTTTQRVDTHSAKEEFKYMSWRDVSGEFVIDIGGASSNHRQAFIKLHLPLQMQFVNDGTAEDFQRQKERFIERNKRDVMYDYEDYLTMDGYKKYNLVRVSDATPKFFGFYWYILSSLLTLSEFYKMYMDTYCITQEFVITKMVSSRQDLNAPQLLQNYIPMAPSIVHAGHAVHYNGPMLIPLNMWSEAPVGNALSYQPDVSAPLIKH